MIIIEKKYLIVEHDKELDCLIHHWKGFATSEQFKEGLVIGHQLFAEIGVSNIIINSQDSGAVRSDDTDFAISLLPGLVVGGLKKFAFVVTEKNIFAKLSAESFNKKANVFQNIKYFESLDSAKQWIAQ